MTTYAGNKSLDAEIYLDLKSGEMTMDYSMNKFGDPYNSNYCCTKNDFKKEPFSVILFEYLSIFPYSLFLISYMAFLVPLIAFAYSKNLIKTKNFQIEHQRLLKTLVTKVRGSYIQEVMGPIKSYIIGFVIPHNLFIQYTLDGDFEKYVSSISLKRNMEKSLFRGKYEIISQRGWAIEFEFIQPPQNGTCKIIYC